MSLVAIVNETGILAPSFDEILAELQAKFKSIYGIDSYIDPDSQDGQLLAIFAKALHDANQTAVMVYQSFSPSTGIGAGLSNNVRINGIARKVPTHSQVSVALIGVANTPVVEGVVSDSGGNKWRLPDLVIIEPSGSVLVTATAIEEGEIRADPDTVTTIVTPTKGWQTVTNPTAAVPGAPVESDGALRLRQSRSVANPAQGLLLSLQGSIAALPGVTASRVYENDTSAVNELGHPQHSITAVVLGGSPQEIARTIHLRKTPGAYPNGPVKVTVTEGEWTHVIGFYIAEQIRVRVRVLLQSRPGFLATTVTLIKERVAAYINSLGIGQRVDQGRIYLPVQFYGASGLARTFEVNSILLTDQPLGDPVNADLEIPFYGVAYCIAEDDVEVFVA